MSEGFLCGICGSTRVIRTTMPQRTEVVSCIPCSRLVHAEAGSLGEAVGFIFGWDGPIAKARAKLGKVCPQCGKKH
jgi:hypothetical protein